MLLSVLEAMGELRVSRSKFYGLANSGQLRLIKIGRKTFVSREELARFIAALPSYISPAQN